MERGCLGRRKTKRLRDETNVLKTDVFTLPADLGFQLILISSKGGTNLSAPNVIHLNSSHP